MQRLRGRDVTPPSVAPFVRLAALSCFANGPAATLNCAVPAALKPWVTFLVTRVTHALRPCSGVRRMRTHSALARHGESKA